MPGGFTPPEQVKWWAPQNACILWAGGMRASIYNAMPIEGVEKLCEFIKTFDKNN